MPKTPQTVAAVDCLAALAQPTRLAIFRLLVVAGSDGMRAGAIAERLGLTHTTLSTYLVDLNEAQLITRVREGGRTFYGANYAAMHGLISYLTRNCCQGHSKACGLAASPNKTDQVLHEMRLPGPGND